MSRRSVSTLTFSITILVLQLSLVAPSQADEGNISLVMARFQGPDPTVYPVEDVFRMWLKDIYADYDWIEITSIPESVSFDNEDPYSGDSAGIALGSEAQADIFLWGVYKVDEDEIIPAFMVMQLPLRTDVSTDANIVVTMFTGERAFHLDQFTNPGPPSDLFRFNAYMILSNFYLDLDSEMSLLFSELAGEFVQSAEWWEVSGYHLNSAIALLNMGQLEDAYSEIEHAIELSQFESPELEQVKLGIEVAMSEAGIVSPALQSIDGIPETAEECHALAVTYDQAGRYNEALAMYDAGIERANTDEMLAALYLDRALCNSLIGDYESALEDAARAVEYDSQNAMAQTRLGEAYVDLSRFGEALPFFQTAIEMSEQDSWEQLYAIRAKGMCNLSMGNLEQGLLDLEAILQTDLFNPYCMERYGVALLRLGDNQGAVDFINAAIDGGYESADGYANRSFAYANLGSLEQGLMDIERAIQLETYPPNRETLIFERSTFKFLMGEYESALLDLDYCISENPDYARSYYQRGYVKALLGNLEGAMADLEICLEMPEETVSHVEVRDLIAEIEAVMP